MTLTFDIKPTTNPTSDQERAAKLANPGFGRVFTDHMAVVQFSQDKGWHSARVECRGAALRAGDLRRAEGL